MAIGENLKPLGQEHMSLEQWQSLLRLAQADVERIRKERDRIMGSSPYGDLMGEDHWTVKGSMDDNKKRLDDAVELETCLGLAIVSGLLALHGLDQAGGEA